MNIILGAGATGLAAGYVSGLPVFEAVDFPGGICASYYIDPETGNRYSHYKEGCYRFEVGGGHWIFGEDSMILSFIEKLIPVKYYKRRAAILLSPDKELIPYPIQNHLVYLDSDTRCQVLEEMAIHQSETTHTMKDWLHMTFCPTLCRMFFYPFHALYTAGLYDKIEPQDAYKSPIKISDIVRGAFGRSNPVGYNVTFAYPKQGLDALMGTMAAGCDIRYAKRSVNIDIEKKRVFFQDGSHIDYQSIISTLPLNRMLELCKSSVRSRSNPYTSVLVVNIGAKRGNRCPTEHWIYVPKSHSGFYRIGFYSHVDASFLPKGDATHRVSIYVEKAYLGGVTLSPSDIDRACQAIINELIEWQYISGVEVIDWTWVDIAYTWAWPMSTWVAEALNMLEQHDIYQVGRYGRWHFQGIADSLKDGLIAGAVFRRIG